LLDLFALQLLAPQVDYFHLPLHVRVPMVEPPIAQRLYLFCAKLQLEHLKCLPLKGELVTAVQLLPEILKSFILSRARYNTPRTGVSYSGCLTARLTVLYHSEMSRNLCERVGAGFICLGHRHLRVAVLLLIPLQAADDAALDFRNL
jgi:hypothetical protein